MPQVPKIHKPAPPLPQYSRTIICFDDQKKMFKRDTERINRYIDRVKRDRKDHA